jgi:hypothetical protein
MGAAIGRWPRRAGWAGIALLVIAALLALRPSREDRREVLGRYSTEYAGLIAVVGAAGIWWATGLGRAGSRQVSRAGRSFCFALEAGVIAAFVFGVAEGLCRLAERPLASFIGGPALVKGYPPATVNEHGLRDPGRPFAKPAGTARIVVLGDSFMFGHGVADDSTCVRHLERALNARGGAPVEVINASHIGYNTASQRALLDSLGLRYQPDLVLLSYVLNDPEEHYLTYPALLPGSLGRAMEWSAFYYLTRAIAFRVLVATGRSPDYQTYLKAMFDPSLPSWQRHREALRGIVADARAAGAPVVAAVWPFAQRGHAFTPYVFAREHAMAVAAVRESGAEVVDLHPVFARDRYQDFALSIADSHPNDRAQRLAAGAIAAFLTERGLAPGAAPPAAGARP